MTPRRSSNLGCVVAINNTGSQINLNLYTLFWSNIILRYNSRIQATRTSKNQIDVPVESLFEAERA